MGKDGYRIEAKVNIYDRDEYKTKIQFSLEECVPTAKDPITHLKERLREEIERNNKAAKIDWAEKWSGAEETSL